MTQQTHTIAESNNFIVLDKYTKAQETGESYQSESDLERELIQDLLNQGYEFISVKSPTAMLANVSVVSIAPTGKPPPSALAVESTSGVTP